MAGLRRADRERVSLPLSEPWWLWLCGLVTLDELRQEDEGASFDIYLNGTERDDRKVGYPNPKRELWAKYREDVIAYAAEVTPGRRPPGFWAWDAPEERVRVSGRMRKRWVKLQGEYVHDSAFDYEQNAAGEWGFYSGEEVDPTSPPRLESEASYLKHHDLLLPGEEKRLTKADFRPELEYEEEER